MKIRMMLAGVLGAALLSGCTAGPSLTVPVELSPAAVSIPSPAPSPEPTPEPSPNTDDLDVLSLSAEDGEILPESLLLAPVELSEVLEGNLTGYARLRVDGWVFEWIQSDIWVMDDMGGWEQQLLVSQEAADGLIFRSSFDVCCENSWAYPRPQLVWTDVDFDGKPDLLFSLGALGAQMASAYACFLQREDGFEEGVGFSGILNPAIDEENQLILGSWRNWAASHSWGMYAYQDGEYVMTRVLTEEPAQYISEDEIIWQWTEGGEVIGRSDEMTEEEIDDLINNENSEWGLQTDRWAALATGAPMYYNG